MKDNVKFTIRELKGVYVKRLNKVYEVDWKGNEYFVPGLTESLSNRAWNIENQVGDTPHEGYRTKQEIEGSCL